MFGKKFDLFTLFGFRVGIDTSWFFLAILVTWSLATGVFPAWHPGLAPVTHWVMGALGAIGLFFSIVLHELAHSLVARRHGVVMRGITLFIFGGVAEMTDEPPSPRAEFQVAIAGPLASLLISLICFTFTLFGNVLGLPEALIGVVNYLSLLNGVLVIFNLIPAFPLDGGRVLRSILWNWKKDLIWATYVTSRIGIGFSFVLIAAGVLRAITGDIVGGIWSFLIGMFLRGAANMSYRQLMLRRSLEGETVRRFMRADPVTVPAEIPVQNLVADYVYKFHYKMFPVMDGGRLFGCVRTREIRALPRETWARYTVREIAIETCDQNSIHPNTHAIHALAKMNQTGATRLLVIEHGELIGVITLKDLLHFLSLKVDLGPS
jgi:Zn-dependent protease/predicted transcriptional regulator